MIHALHTWTWVSALTGFQLLPTAPTSSTLSLSQPSSFLSRFPCMPALTRSLKPSVFPISTLCTKPTNATLQEHHVYGFWAWAPFALFSMENYPPEVRTTALLVPINLLSKKKKPHRNPPDHQLHTPKSPRQPLSKSMVMVPRHHRLRHRPPKKPTSPLSKRWTAAPTIDPSFQSPSLYRQNPSKTRRVGCETSPTAWGSGPALLRSACWTRQAGGVVGSRWRCAAGSGERRV